MYNGSTIVPCVIHKQCLIRAHCSIVTVTTPTVVPPLQHLLNKVLYQNASKGDIQHIRPLAQSAHATIRSPITQPLAPLFNKGSLFYSHCDVTTTPPLPTGLITGIKDKSRRRSSKKGRIK
jgi:hypothetical protein